MKKSALKKKPVKKPHAKDRDAERTVKTKSLADFVDKKVQEIISRDPDTLAQEDVVCPFCKWRHDPEDLRLGKRSSGMVKCSDCGEGFEYEALRKVVFTTFVP